MAILTKSRVNYDADPAIINSTLAAVRSIQDLYPDAMATLERQPPTSGFPTSGTYTHTRTWTNEADAQQFCIKIAALLDASPTLRQFIISDPAVVVT